MNNKSPNTPASQISMKSPVPTRGMSILRSMDGAGSPAASKAPEEGRVLTVGRGITLSGQISTCDHLHVEGHVEATVTDARDLEITENGHFKGTVEVETAVIAGALEGELIVSGLLRITETGKVGGKIRYGEIEIQRGGMISGELICPGQNDKNA